MVYYRPLDGIRSLAALMVFFYHFFNCIQFESLINHPLLMITRFGHTGVTLFFVLSGFLITRILLNSKTKPAYFKSFYLKRALRIFPLYYLYLFIYFILLPLILGMAIKFSICDGLYLIYLQNFLYQFSGTISGPWHFWSLAIEEHFYLAWPVIVYFLSLSRLKYVAFGIIAFSIFIRFYINGFDIQAYPLSFARFDSFAFGGLLAIMEVRNQLVKRNSIYFFLGIVLCLLLMLMGKWLGGWFEFEAEFFTINLLYFSCIGACVTASDKTSIIRGLSNATFTFLARISYGIYVFHTMAIFIVLRFVVFESIMVKMLAALTLTILLATLSYYGFERFFLFWGRKKYDKAVVNE